MPDLKTREIIKFSYDWWFAKGEKDCRHRWTIDINQEPTHPKVKPYMQGWEFEAESSRNSLGKGLNYQDFH